MQESSAPFGAIQTNNLKTNLYRTQNSSDEISRRLSVLASGLVIAEYSSEISRRHGTVKGFNGNFTSHFTSARPLIVKSLMTRDYRVVPRVRE